MSVEAPAVISPPETDDGPDPNQVRRHAKKMLSEIDYRRKYRRIDFYRPNRKQMEFHNNRGATELMLRAGNQQGKTQGAGGQLTMDALALYPDWYEGRKFLTPPKIERPMEFLAWAACTTSAKTRDGIQLKMLGDIREDGGLGTGLIPLDNIVGRPTMARGISDFVDSVTLRRETGGKAIIRYKTYEMGRDAFQGEPVDEILCDEDICRSDKDPLASIHGELLARLTTTGGRILYSMTPLLGMSPIRKRFKERAGTGECVEVLMTIDDCRVSNGGHIPDERVAEIIRSYKASEVQTRIYGADLQGEGAVFETPVGEIKEIVDPATFPRYWRWLWGMDFRHSGSNTTGHPFAAVLGAHDPDTDTIHVVHAVRMLGLATAHVAAMKTHPMWEAPCAWPHDGGRGGSLLSGDTVSQIYKKLGLNMRPEHATFRDGGYNFEAGITEMDLRLSSNRLKIAAHLSQVFDEYQGYHRDGGIVNKVDDDLLSAIRVLCMDIRFAKMPERFIGFSRRQIAGQNAVAAGTDFDLFGAN